MSAQQKQQSVIIIGGGIGGLAAAQALTQQGIRVLLLEQAAEIGEIGAGIQLGPNAYSALDALGAGEAARSRSVFLKLAVRPFSRTVAVISISQRERTLS